jgi:hypothetical protein
MLPRKVLALFVYPRRLSSDSRPWHTLMPPRASIYATTSKHTLRQCISAPPRYVQMKGPHSDVIVPGPSQSFRTGASTRTAGPSAQESQRAAAPSAQHSAELVGMEHARMDRFGKFSSSHQTAPRSGAAGLAWRPGVRRTTSPSPPRFAPRIVDSAAIPHRCRQEKRLRACQEETADDAPRRRTASSSRLGTSLKTSAASSQSSHASQPAVPGAGGAAWRRPRRRRPSSSDTTVEVGIP